VPDTSGGAPESTFMPIVSRVEAPIDARELRRLQAIAACMVKNEPGLSATDRFRIRAGAGPSTHPRLVIGDGSEIALTKDHESAAYQYRLSLLARQGDLVAFDGDPHPDFERYRLEYVGDGPILALSPGRVAGTHRCPLADRCRLDRAVFSQIAEATRRNGGLTIVPHIGLGSPWRLARAVAEATGLDVDVMSSPPRLTRRVNNKLWFARLVPNILGDDAIPPTYSAGDVATLARNIRTLARKGERVVVKVPDSSGGAGNICLSARDLADVPLAEVGDRIRELLRAVGWRDRYPLLVGLWEAPALSSPSVQLWIPSIADGPPIIEGLFEQVLEGPDGLFIGSIPAQLPKPWQSRLAEEAMRLATVLQLLGYFGRCSFDSLLIGPSYASSTLHWIECNGRWGGISLPMTIVNRLKRGAAEFIVVERTDDRRPRWSFADTIQALGNLLFRSGVRHEGIVLLSPVEIESGRGVQMLAVAEKTADASALADRALEILWGTPSSRLAG